jgi:hypothetical protein
MTINEIKHPFNSRIHDGDIISKTNFLLIDDENRIYRNGKKINIKLKLEWPIVRIISDDFFILIDSDSSMQKDNAWIINNNGTIERSFYIGNATDVILTKTHIVASYSKCSLDTSRIFTISYKNPDYETCLEKLSSKKALSREGLAVFDFRGNCLFKYMTDASDEDFIPFMEVCSFLKKDEDTIYLLPYLFNDGLAILEFSLKNYSLKNVLNLEEIVAENYFPRAMTKKHGNWYFLMTNYEEMEKGDINNLKSHLFKMKSSQRLEKLGECCFSVKMHGNYDGSFSVPLGVKDNNQNSCYLKI